ncbi:hypothetical protein HCU64_24775 [Methylobacterium sp. C25]|uniref:hypothetical protein n=1 Tax=Methylobacterium sp. C25 TaxID=2721622 RepID=UPI001F3D1D41|nr:hypothetical protein [Methylobacterium sp. C25]MCE4226958.1 hypothetical protein [Methylobacterium sp. C25]
MGELIRPDFGQGQDTETAAKHEALSFFGQAAGYAIALVRDVDERGNAVLQVVVGLVDGTDAQAVATLPSTAAGEVDGTMIGTAVLKSFELIEAHGKTPQTQ